MVTWRLLPESYPDAAWDAILQGLPDGNPFQGSSWARHKENFGWRALRALAIGEDGAPLAATQFLAKRRLGFTVLWARGGPLGGPELWDDGLRSVLRESGGSGPVYMRFCSYRPQNGSVETLVKNGWQHPTKALNRNLTFLLELAPEEELRRGLSANWAHNLRRGLKRSRPRVWENPKPEDVIAVYRMMENYKGMHAQYRQEELGSLLKHFSSSWLLLRADDDAGNPIALRACATQDGKAWDLLAASSQAGRQSYASYALLWNLLQICRERGVKTYDLGGADPEKAKGVHDFKKGTGARELEYLGEWDWAWPGILRGPCGALLSRFASKA